MVPEMLTVNEAARRLKVNPQTLRRWIRAGVLPARKLGKKEYRISAADLEERVSLPTPAQAARRTDAAHRVLLLRDQLRNRGLSVTELMAESRAEMEGRGATRGR